MLEKEITFDRFIRGLLAVLSVAAAVYVVHQLSAVLLPFFIAWLLAYMIYPLVKFFQYKLRLRNRILCIIIVLLLLLAAIVGFLYLVVPPVLSEFLKLRDLTSDLIKKTGDSSIARNIETFLQQNIDKNAVMQLLHENNMMEALNVAINQIWSLIVSTFGIIIAILSSCLTLLYLFFILKDYERLSQGWIKLVPKRSRRVVSVLVDDMQRGMNSYFRGQALVAFLVGVLFCVGFLIIDFPLAIGLGMFIGVLNLVPYLQALGFIPTVILAFLRASETGESFWLILFYACIVFVVVQSIQDAILVPKIMGKLLGLHPAVILLSLSVWGFLLGMIGLIIALPLTTLLLSYYRRFIERDERRVTLAEERKRSSLYASSCKPGADSAPQPAPSAAGMQLVKGNASPDEADAPAADSKDGADGSASC